MRNAFVIAFSLVLASAVADKHDAGTVMPLQRESSISCILKSSGVIVGGGIVLGFGESKATQKVYLLTARHVVTYNHEYLDSLSVVYKIGIDKTDERLIGEQTKNRWLTVDNPKLDVAWIELRDGEYPDRLKGLDFDGLIRPTVAKRNGMDVTAYTPFSSKHMPCVGTTVIPDIVFASNRFLKKVDNVPVLLFNRSMHINESGSPVFVYGAKDSVDFLGVIAASLEGRSCAVNVERYIDLIKKNSQGANCVWLKDLPHLW